MDEKIYNVKPRKVCINCIHLCRLDNGRFTCTCKDSGSFNKGTIDVEIALKQKCDNHTGVRNTGYQYIFYR